MEAKIYFAVKVLCALIRILSSMGIPVLSQDIWLVG